MPTRPPRVCNRCGRPAPARGRCPCNPPWQGSSYGRSGTDRRQRALRDRQLQEHPICQWPGCERLATDGDHIVPWRTEEERLDPANYQSLCEPHHREKTQAASRAARLNRRSSEGRGV